MRQLILSIVMVLLLSPVLVQGATEAPTPANIAQYYANSYALLIGINNYQHVDKLRYAVNDVTELRRVLINQYAFPADHVVMLTDDQATKDGITHALSQIVSKMRVGKDDRILIYFSGHGQTVKTADGGEKGFLLPVDASVSHDTSDPGPYYDTCVPMDMVWEALDLCPARHVLLIADACFSGLLAKTRSVADTSEEDISPLVLAGKRARQVITAGDSTQKTIEKPEWGHGAFTYLLLDELRGRAKVPGSIFTAHDLYVAIQRPLINLTADNIQTPQFADKDTTGEFLFIVPDAPGAQAPRISMPSGTLVTDATMKSPGGTAIALLPPTTPESLPLTTPASPATATPGKKPWLCGLLTLCIPGAGQCYDGHWVKGLTIAASYSACTLLLVDSSKTSGGQGTADVAAAGLTGIVLWSTWDAYDGARVK